jgi:hypothetical protein
LLCQLRKRVILSYILIKFYRGGFIDEKIYEYSNDPDQTAEDLLKISPEMLLKQEKELIAPWINTYTFTKSLSERAI